MALLLKIENESELADGGPLSFKVEGKRGVDIGRDSHLDWTLPDPSRYISSKHCEVRYRDNAYWLHDVSTNGTFVNGGENRMSEPHRLRNGDRIAVGHYLIRVTLTEDAVEMQPPRREVPPVHAPARDVWAAAEEPSGSRADRQADWQADWQAGGQAGGEYGARSSPSSGRSITHGGDGDFLDWMADLPALATDPSPPRRRPAAQAASPVDDWSDEPVPTRAVYMQPRPEPVLEPAPGAQSGGPSTGLWDTPHGSTPDAQIEAAPPLVSQPEAAPAKVRPIVRVAATGRVASPPHEDTAPAVVAPSAGPPAKLDAPDGGAFLRAFADAAGIKASDLAHHDAEAFGRLLGGLVRLTVDELRQLLEARFEAKRMARSSQQTQISGVDNNPMKFTPTTEDTLKLMFGPANRSYLDARRAVEKSFGDIKSHQLETYAAMQAALLELAREFDPKQIDTAAGPESALGSLVGSRKSRAWDIFVARWDAKTLRQDNGILGAFMEYFSKHYDAKK